MSAENNVRLTGLSFSGMATPDHYGPAPSSFPAAKEDMPRRNLPRRIRIALAVVSEFYDVPVVSLLGRRRNRPISWPRHVAMWIAKRIVPDASYPDLGRYFQRDHSTVISGLYRVNAHMARDFDYANEVIELLAEARRRDDSDRAQMATLAAPVLLKPCTTCDRVVKCKSGGYCWKAGRAAA